MLLNGYYDRKWTVLEFLRPIDSKDTEHDLRLDLAAYLLWAVGPPGDEIREGGYGDFNAHVKRGVVKVHFPTGTATHVKDLSREEAHASLMLYGWGFFAVISIFCSRYMKDPLGSWWFVIHISMALMNFVLTITGFSVIISFVSHNRDPHFNTVHKILGLVITICLTFQILIGTFTRIWFDPDREYTPYFPDKFHWWFGRGLIILSFVNIFTGFFEFSKTGLAPYILLLSWVGSIIAFVVLFEMYHRGDMPSRTTVMKEYKLLESGVHFVQQNNSALLFCFGGLVLIGLLLITLSVSLLER